MKKYHVQDAVGLKLCRDVTAVINGASVVLFHRGHEVAKEDVARMLACGNQTVYVFDRFSAGEIHEDDAAVRLAEAIPVEGAHYEGPSAGVVTLYADRDGMFRVNRELLTELNSVRDFAVASLPDHYPVRAGMKLATIRSVALITQNAQLTKAETVCRGLPLFRLLPYEQKNAAIIITGSEIFHGRVQDRFAAIAQTKLADFPCSILGTTVCDDDPEMITAAINSFVNAGADLILLSGGMGVDPDDMTPAAIRALDARVITNGLPLDPGRMSLVAYLDKIVLLGVSSDALAMPASPLDVLLPQIFTGTKFTAEELRRLGDGGLCQNCPEGCRYPNCSYGKY